VPTVPEPQANGAKPAPAQEKDADGKAGGEQAADGKTVAEKDSAEKAPEAEPDGRQTAGGKAANGKAPDDKAAETTVDGKDDTADEREPEAAKTS